jgi:NDP-sugar pyrophosphorylase family protein
MRAVIMAGGRGTRLLPYTSVFPKPLMPLYDRPIIDVVLRQLVKAGVEEIHISVGHLGSLIESWISNEPSYGVPVHFWYEDAPLGTAGALKSIALEEPFLAMNGDILTTLPYGELYERHRKTQALATIAVKERAVDIDYGVVHTDASGMVVALEEKPQIPYKVSMGVYAFSPEIHTLIEPAERIDFPDLLLRAKDDHRPVQTFRFDGYWRDIGNRDDYEAAIADFAADRDRFIAPDS